MTTQTSPQTSLSPEVTTGSVVTKPVVIPVDKAISWAKLYLSLGWSLVPISPDTKIPTVAWKKYQEAPPTLEEVTSWLNHGWYLALVTGDVSGICVVDDDRIKHNLPEYGFTSPLIATTQSGGKHYYYLYDREIHTHVNSKIHVDLKAWHSYVLLPPFKGRKWETDLVSNIKNLYPLPEETITLIRSDMENQVNHTPLEKQALLDVKEGSRSDSLYKMACSIFNEFDFDTGKRLLIGVNDTYSPPLPEKQRDYDIQRAYDYVQAHPKDTIVQVSTAKLKGVPSLSNIETPDLILDVPENISLLNNVDFLNTTYPETKWLVEGLLRIGGISFIVGESGTGKTIAALTIAKSVSTGTPWLDKFPCPQLNILIIDKENTPSDIQKHFINMGIRSPNIFLFYKEDDYQIIDTKAHLTPIAKQLQRLIKENNIGLVIFDSAIDFVLGDENDSRTVAANINAWKEMCGQATILSIHHESKPDSKNKKKAQDRMRGSSHWLASAQSVISLSVFTISHPEILMVEHAKVRSARKHKPFQIEMVIRPDITNLKETKVDGYKYLREIEPAVLKVDAMADKIVEFLDKHTDVFFSIKELAEGLDEDPTKRNTMEAIKIAADKLASTGDLTKGGNGVKNDPTTYKRCVSNMLEKVIKEEENEQLEM